VEEIGPLDLYVVTARHLIDLGRQQGGLGIRVNLIEGETRDILTEPDGWVSHPTADVAARRVDTLDGLDVRVITTFQFVTDQYLATQDLLGEPVFFVGLFTMHPGQHRNQPIVRFGEVAMLPGEDVTFEPLPGTEMRMAAFLVEAHSWGGHSGAPAFVRHPFIVTPGPNPVVRIGLPKVTLLGVVAGHYDLPRDLPQELARATVAENAGIAVVVPAQRILEVLELERTAI